MTHGHWGARRPHARAPVWVYAAAQTPHRVLQAVTDESKKPGVSVSASGSVQGGNATRYWVELHPAREAGSIILVLLRTRGPTALGSSSQPYDLPRCVACEGESWRSAT